MSIRCICEVVLQMHPFLPVLLPSVCSGLCVWSNRFGWQLRRTTISCSGSKTEMSEYYTPNLLCLEHCRGHCGWRPMHSTPARLRPRADVRSATRHPNVLPAVKSQYLYMNGVRVLTTLSVLRWRDLLQIGFRVLTTFRSVRLYPIGTHSKDQHVQETFVLFSGR